MKKSSAICPLIIAAILLAGCAAVAQEPTATATATAAPAAQSSMVTIHYHRFDGDYERAGLWTWDKDNGRHPAQDEMPATGKDDYGVYFVIDSKEYGPESGTRGIGFIPRLRNDWNAKDGSDRFWTPALGKEIWLIGNDEKMYTSRPDIAPKIQHAFLDDANKLTLRLSEPLTVDADSAAKFHVKGPDGAAFPISSVAGESGMEKSNTVTVSLGKNADLSQTLTVDLDGYKGRDALLRNALLNRDLFYSDQEMGIIFEGDRIVFRAFAPMAKTAAVMLYDNATDQLGRKEIAMTSIGKGVWEAAADKSAEGKFYMLNIDGGEWRDINSKVNISTVGRALVENPRSLDPPGFRPIKRPATIKNPTDAIIWEVSVRDFTSDENSGVPAEKRGKYLGAAMRGTKVPGTDLQTGIDHLVALGVTHVQIMPIQDFDNREGDAKEYNWGYMTTSFDSPDGWFASDPSNDSRIREYKEMIKAFHDAGLRVVMDVVYNHTAPNASFESLAPGYYHRRRDDGNYWNGSGTGNEFRSEAPMARKFIVDSCRYWTDEYGVDGFRFDLMGLVDLDTMKEIKGAVQKIDPTLLVYGEPWSGGDSGLEHLTDKPAVAGSGLAAFNDDYRNALKGAPEGPEPGFIHDGRNAGNVKGGIEGSIKNWAKQPTESINYMTCHDNLTLWDKTLIAAPGATDAERVAMNRLGIGVLSVSQGIMFLHGGTEFGYGKAGNGNSYNAPNSVNSLKWTNLKTREALNAYTGQMIALRRAHPVFRLSTSEAILARLKFPDQLCATEKTIVFTLDGNGVSGESWKNVTVLINGESTAQTFKLPDGTWTVYSDGKSATLTSTSTVTGAMETLARSVVVLAN
ncbi:type I pullulanase [soil metagenome]